MFKDFKKIQFKMPKKFSVWYIVLAFGFFYSPADVLMNWEAGYPYSDFRKKIKEGNVIGMPYH